MDQQTTTPGPRTDAEIPGYLKRLGLPGLVDLHTHFLPQQVLDKVWAFFAEAEQHYGYVWPIHYQVGEAERLQLLRGFGCLAITSLPYPHKAGMATWLNTWAAELASAHPDVVHCATMFPESGVATYVREAVDAGANLFKVHVRVGGFSPDDPALNEAWGVLEERGVPVIIHAGSAPRPGRHTGPEPVTQVLTHHPGLRLVIAHMGMSEYHAFADLAEAYPNVHLDTTMVGTDFANRVAPLPDGYLDRLPALVDRIILGTDFPNIPYPYAHQLEALTRWGLGDDWMRRVCYFNGARLLGLDR